MKHFLLPIVIVLALSSCRSSIISAELSRAESLFHQYPDSSLFCLRRIKQEQLKTREERARYALWMSAALDKNYFDVTSDTLIRKAVDYYSEHGEARHRMLAWYYEGIVLKNGGYYPKAIIAFEKAEKEALSIDDYYHLGLICRNKALVFSHTRNGEEAIRCHQKAVRYFEQAQAIVYKSYEEMALAIDYYNDKRFSESDSLLHQIESHCSVPAVLYRCKLRLADILIAKDSLPGRAVEIYRQVPLKYYTSLEYARRALAFEEQQEKDSSDYWMRMGYSKCHTPVDSASLDYIQSQIALRRGRFEEAYHLVKSAVSVQDSLTRELLKNSISGAQRDYYKNEAERQEEQLRNAQREKVLGLIIGLLLALIGIIWFVSDSREKNRRLQEQITRAAMKEKEISQTTKINAHLLGSLFSSRIEHLDELTRAYYNTDDEGEKEVLFKQIKQSVSSIRNNPDVFVSLEENLNQYCNGIMSKLHNQVPKIMGNNIKVIMLFFAGFPYDVIQLIMNSSSIESLKVARSRYRKAIMEARAPDEALFLEMLEMRKRPVSPGTVSSPPNSPASTLKRPAHC